MKESGNLKSSSILRADLVDHPDLVTWTSGSPVRRPSTRCGSAPRIWEGDRQGRKDRARAAHGSFRGRSVPWTGRAVLEIAD